MTNGQVLVPEQPRQIRNADLSAPKHGSIVLVDYLLLLKFRHSSDDAKDQVSIGHFWYLLVVVTGVHGYMLYTTPRLVPNKWGLNTNPA